MAAFSSSQLPFLLDTPSLNFLQNAPFIKNKDDTTLSPSINELNNVNNTAMSLFYCPQALFPTTTVTSLVSDHQVMNGIANEGSSSSCLDNMMNSPAKKQSNNTESSTVLESGEQVTQKLTPVSRKRKTKTGSSLDSLDSKEAKEGKPKKQKKGSEMKEEEEKKCKGNNEQKPPTGYIHVRARRGQATDSHSLAERVRREKISERMKILQKLVPGCDKVTGKALMLDEIINYVQSLQNQVEFLSMKLASANPFFYEFGMDPDALMLTPIERLSHLASALQPVQQGRPNQQATAFADATTATAATTTTAANDDPITNSNNPLTDISPSILFQGQTSAATSGFTQDNVNLLWDIDEQRHKFSYISLLGNNLCSFH